MNASGLSGPLVFIELSAEKLVDRLSNLICMILKVNLWVGKVGFMFCDK